MSIIYITSSKESELASRLAAQALARYYTLVERAYKRFCDAAYQLGGYRVNYLQKEDQQRVFMLWHQIERTGLTFEEGLSVLLDHWADQGSRRHTGRSGTLPIRIWNLLGPVSQAVLANYAKKTYPSGEHRKIQKEELRQSLITEDLRLASDITFYSTYQLSREYADRVEQRRKLQREFKIQRHYRGNPWL